MFAGVVPVLTLPVLVGVPDQPRGSPETVRAWCNHCAGCTGDDEGLSWPRISHGVCGALVSERVFLSDLFTIVALLQRGSYEQL